jgi:hypothetical protein
MLKDRGKDRANFAVGALDRPHVVRVPANPRRRNSGSSRLRRHASRNGRLPNQSFLKQRSRAKHLCAPSVS